VPGELDQDGVEDGKRLVRAQAGSGQSLAEQLAEQFQKLTWRTPLYALRLRGRYPLKLLAVPEDPLPGDNSAGAEMLEGRLSWRGETLALSQVHFSSEAIQPDFANHLQRFNWLRDVAAAGPRRVTAPIAEMLTRQWLAAHAEKVSEPAWQPANWGWRILNWSAHAPLILSSSDLVYRSAVLNGLARGARHLDRTADQAIPGLPRIAAWAGVVTAGLLIAGGDARRSYGEAGLARALASGMSSDGGCICRTPRGQADLILLLAMLAKVYEAKRALMPDVLTRAIQAAVPPLLGVTLGDGALSSWQGSGPMPKEDVKAIIGASGVRTRSLRKAREWGYHRISAGQTALVVDGAPPPNSRRQSGGCASTLAFELSDGPHRLIVNCGGAGAAMLLSPSLAQGLRTTAAHSTLTLCDTNSTAILADGSLGKGVTAVELEREESDQGSRIEASHDGYVRRFGLLHKRTITISADGRDVRGDDVLLPAKARPKPMTSAFAIRFHLGEGVEATPTADGLGALLRIDRGPLWQFRCRGANLAIDASVWVSGAGQLRHTQQLVVMGEAAPGGASVSWVLKRAG
jgi:uncharacterized heparinase superfamily protein